MIQTVTLSNEEKQEIFERFSYAEDAFRIDGPITTTVVKEDGTFRNYPIEPTDFFFSSIRFGKSESTIFVFEPEDKDERYEKAEVALKDLDKFFPTFTEALKLWMIDQYVDRKDADAAALEAAVIEATNKPEDVVRTLYDLEVQRRKEASKDEIAALENQPNFGLF